MVDFGISINLWIRHEFGETFRTRPLKCRPHQSEPVPDYRDGTRERVRYLA